MSFNGANVELGYAFAKGKYIYILGKVDRNAMYCFVKFCKNLNELLKILKDINNVRNLNGKKN